MKMDFRLCVDQDCLTTKQHGQHGHFFHEGRKVGLPAGSCVMAERDLAVFKKQGLVSLSEAQDLMGKIREMLPVKPSPPKEEGVHLIVTNYGLEEEGLALIDFLRESGNRVDITKNEYN